MPSQKVTIRSRKYDQSIRREWPCELIEQKGPLLAVVGEFDEDIGSISRGTISYEYFWLDRWYNVFRFHSPRGELLNYYCNISLPPTFEDGVIDYVDLDIDVLVWRDHSY